MSGVKVELPRNATTNYATLRLCTSVDLIKRRVAKNSLPTGLTVGRRRPRRLEDVSVLGHHQHRDEVHHGEGEELSLKECHKMLSLHSMRNQFSFQINKWIAMTMYKLAI